VSNYLRFVLFAVVGIVLTPVLVHGLGDRDYGLWMTVFSLTGYFGLLDQGIRPSLVRYVSRDHALGDVNGLSRTVSSAMALYAGAGALTMLLAVIVATQVPQRMALEPDQVALAPTLVLLVGGTIALGFPLGVFGAILSGLQRYDLANWVGMVAGIVRAVAFIVVVRMGGGLVALGWTSLLVNVAGHLVTAVMARRLLPDVRIAPAFVDAPHLRAIASYSGWAFIGALASNIAFQTDSIVITSILGAALVTPFAIASGLVEHARSLVVSAAVVLSPTASEMDTRGEHQKLHAMLIAGSKYSVLLSWPVLIGLALFGPELLTAWVGRAYAPAALLITILVVPTMVALPQATASSVLYGISRHRGVVILSIVAAVANLALSIVWARWPAPMVLLFGRSLDPGLVGVAMGTAVPLFVVSGWASAWYACRALELPLGRYLLDGMLLPGLASLAFLLPALAAKLWLRPEGWVPLFATCAACWLVFGVVAWRFALPASERERWGRLLAGFFGRANAAEPAAERRTGT
jgi:O-antigen/teichoic acid export membrane protein